MPIGLRNVSDPKMFFSRFLWRIQNAFNKSRITSADLTHPDMVFDTKKEADETKKQSDIDIRTFDMMDIVRTGVSFETPTSRKYQYNQYREMIKTNELIATCTDIYADNVTTSDAMDGSVFHVLTEDKNVFEELSGLFFHRIDIENVVYDIAYEMMAMGDSFWEVVPMDKMEGVKTLRKLYSIDKIHRIEKDGRLVAWFIEDDSVWEGPDFNMYSDSSSGQFMSQQEFDAFAINLNKYIDENKIAGGKLLAPWQVCHFRVPDRVSDHKCYGKSVLSAVSYTWQLLRPLEDSLVVYRITRAPERFKFLIEVGNMGPEESLKFMQRVKDMNNKESFIDPQTGQISKKYLALDALANYYLPVRQGQKSIDMEQIQAGQNLGEINDVEYFNKKIRIALKVPQSYLQEEAGDARTRPLAQMDIQFAKTIQRHQKHILKGLTKVAIIHLWLSGYDEELKKFSLSMTAPSALEKQIRYELFTEKFNLAGIVASSKLWSNYTISTKILGMTPKEAEHESKLMLWQNNNIMPEEGMQADMVMPSNIDNIKGKIEQLAQGGAQGPDTGMGGMGMGGMGMGGGEMGGLGGGMGAPSGGMPASVGQAGAPSVESRGMLQLMESIARLAGSEKRLAAFKKESSAAAHEELIHLFNEGELDKLSDMVPAGDSEEGPRALNESTIERILDSN